MSKNKSCPDCGVDVGELHKSGCDVERCPNCGGQLLSCVCTGSEKTRKWIEKNLIPWTGVWLGTEECREFGWYAKLVLGMGWIPCKAEELGASPDLNRLHAEAVWNKKKKRFVRR